MRATFVLTRNAFREMIRERTVAILFFGAILLILLSFFVGSLSLDEQRRILVHLGFGAVHLSCLAIVLFKGAYLIQREIDRQTCLMVLARPVSRFQFLLGHYFAVSLLLMAHIAVQGVLLYSLLGFLMDVGRFITVLTGIFVEMALILACTFLAVQFVRPVVGLLSGFAVFLVGNWLEEMKFFADRAKDEGFRIAAHAIRWAFPNLHLLNLRSESYLLEGFHEVNTFTVMLHFSFWIAAFLMVAGIAFSRRDLV